MSTWTPPCAACKLQRRKCNPDCIFAPYFPPEDPQKFASVHKVFGAANVAKLLADLHPSQRADTAISLAYEAEARLRDPVYGCVGIVAALQDRLNQLRSEINNARRELARTRPPPPDVPSGVRLQEVISPPQPRHPSSAANDPSYQFPPPLEVLRAQRLAAALMARENFLRIKDIGNLESASGSGGFNLTSSATSSAMAVGYVAENADYEIEPQIHRQVRERPMLSQEESQTSVLQLKPLLKSKEGGSGNFAP